MEVAAETVVKATPEQFKEMTNKAFSNNGIGAKPVAKIPTTEPANTNNNPPADPPPAQQPPAEVKTPVAINYDELSDDERNDMLAKLTGGKIKNIKELSDGKIEDTPEQKEEKARAKKQKALEYALGTGKIKQSDYDTAVLIKGKTNRDIALDLFTQDAKEDNPKITLEEAEELFKDYYMEEAEESDPRRKLLLKEMNRNADRYRTDATKDVDGIEAIFDSYQTGEQRFATYGKQVDSLFETLTKDRTIKFSYPGANNTAIETEIAYALDEADIKSLKRTLRSADVFRGLGADSKDLKDKEILDYIEYNLSANTFSKMMGTIAQKAAEKGRLDAEAFYKAIPVRTATNLGIQNEETGGKKKIVHSEEVRKRFPTSAAHGN